MNVNGLIVQDKDLKDGVSKKLVHTENIAVCDTSQ